MSLIVHRAQRTDALAAALAEVLAHPLADPMQTEIVAVPARGVERWLSQTLSHSLGSTTGAGVAANIDYSSPTSLVQSVMSQVTGQDPRTDPWRPERLLWSVLAALDASMAQPWAVLLAAHLGADAGDGAGDPRPELRRARRLSVARKIAGLFASYSEQRPAMIRDWLAGTNSDGTGEDLASEREWQPQLFRVVRDLIGVPSLAERLPQVCAALRAEPSIVALPDRLSIFGPTRLSTQELDVLTALAAHREVHLFVPQASPNLWADVMGEKGKHPERLVRQADRSAALAKNPLLRSLGRDSREFHLRLGALGEVTSDLRHGEVSAADGVLGALQRSIAENAVPAGEHLLAKGDRSIQVHASFGRDRQVDVLREVLVGLLADDPTLEPRDILVMCPDIEAYAPLLLAAFGSGDSVGLDPTESHPGTRIRVKLADRAIRQTNPVLGMLAGLLDLADARLTASEVLGFAGLEPVRRRFGFDDDQLDRLHRWTAASGIRWGLTQDQRAEFGLPSLAQNTWRAGLERILVGVAMSEDAPDVLGTALPLDDVDSSHIELAGRFAELVGRIAAALYGFRGDHSPAAWSAKLSGAVRSLAAVADADAWQLDQALRTVARIAEDAGAQAVSTTLRLGDVRALLADEMRGRPTRANFRTGELTICSMVPMRSVPHRVICLLGLDDGEFPRAGSVDGDDLLAMKPLIGERDRTSEDRQLLLDAIVAATSNLVLIYSGTDERTGAARPPAAALGEVLDVIDDLAYTDDGRSAATMIRTSHPLQPFDSRNFQPGALGSAQAFSFDRHALAGARALQGAAAEPEPTPFLPAALPALPSSEVDLSDLIRFYAHPVKAFLKDRLSLSLGTFDNDVSDDIPLTLDNLQQWAIGDRMLKARLRGHAAAAVLNAERWRGELPPSEGGILETVNGNVETVVNLARRHLVGAAHHVGIDLHLDPYRLVGSVGPMHGTVLATIGYSAVNDGTLLKSWISLLAAAAAGDGSRPQAVVIGRQKSRRLSAPPPEKAVALLTDLLTVRELGLRWPIPLLPKTSGRLADLIRRGHSVEEAIPRADSYWAGGDYPGERAGPEVDLVWGPGHSLDEIIRRCADESPAGMSIDLPDLATRIYAPMLAASEDLR